MTFHSTDWRKFRSGKKGVLAEYTCAFGDLEASQKTFSFTRDRLDLEERQVQLTYRLGPKDELSYGNWNFRFIRLDSDSEPLNSHNDGYTTTNLLIGLDRGMNILPIVKAPFIGGLVPASDPRAKVESCDQSDCMNIFIYTLSVTPRNL